MRLEEALYLGCLYTDCLLIGGAVIPPGLLFGLGLLSTDRWGQTIPKWPPPEEQMPMNIPKIFAFNVFPHSKPVTPCTAMGTSDCWAQSSEQDRHTLFSPVEHSICAKWLKKPKSHPNPTTAKDFLCLFLEMIVVPSVELSGKLLTFSLTKGFLLAISLYPSEPCFLCCDIQDFFPNRNIKIYFFFFPNGCTLV